MAYQIPDSTIEEIKARIDLGDLVASYGIALRHSGSRLMACCPFHGEKTPSFSIDTAKGLYHCFGCGESGDAIKFVMKQDALPFGEAVRKLASMCGVEIKEQQEDPGAKRRKRLYALMAEVAQFYHRCLRQMKGAQIARDYLAKRELDEKTQEDFLIGFAPDGADVMMQWAEKNGYTMADMEAAGILKAPNRPGDSGYHRFSNRLMFTVRDRQGRVVAFSGRQLVENKRSGKYVNSPETDIFKKSNVLFGLDRAAGAIAKAPHREVIVCEGQIDCIRLHISGFPVAVAGQGTAFTEEHVKMLSRVADAALLVYDDDAAGHKATIRSAGLLLAAGIAVRVVRLPDGDDPDSFIRSKGAEAFAKLCENAESIIQFQVGVERGKEANPDSVDAVSRISKAVLMTISQCPNAVLKAGMVGEAAKMLGIPVLALNEELGKVKSVPRASSLVPRDPLEPRPSSLVPRAGAEDENAAENDVRVTNDDAREGSEASGASGEAREEGVEAAEVIPPPQCEVEFMAFLMSNEASRELAELCEHFVPDDVFAHAFTRKFVAEWLARAKTADALQESFTEGLSGEERNWMSEVLVGMGNSLPSALGTTAKFREFVCVLWQRYIERLRGALNYNPSDNAEIEWRGYLTKCRHSLKTKNWAAVEKLIADFKSRKTEKPGE